MQEAHVLVLTGYGTNCERETAYAARIAGADRVEIAHLADLVAERVCIADFNFLVFPGGFLDGDNLGAAQAAALRLKHTQTRSGRLLLDDILDLHQRGGLILGICNGFQLLVKLGLLPAAGGRYLERQVSLGHNDSARFEDRWVHLDCPQQSPCVFTRDLPRLFLPIRHGEGKIVVRDEALLQELVENNLIAMRYTDETGEPTQSYPANPNGSPLAIAGLTDPSGRIFGLMPHPEAYNDATNHPAWTRGETGTPGTALFTSGVRFLHGQ